MHYVTTRMMFNDIGEVPSKGLTNLFKTKYKYACSKAASSPERHRSAHAPCDRSRLSAAGRSGPGWAGRCTRRSCRTPRARSRCWAARGRDRTSAAWGRSRVFLDETKDESFKYMSEPPMVAHQYGHAFYPQNQIPLKEMHMMNVNCRISERESNH